MEVASRYTASKKHLCWESLLTERQKETRRPPEGGMGRRAGSPADFQGTKPLISPGLHPGPAARRDQAEAREEEGPAWGRAGSCFILLPPLQRPQECPRLGAGQPASEVALTLR